MALAGPPIVFGLGSLLHDVAPTVPEVVDAFLIATAVVLCPLAAAFFGSAAVRQIQKSTPRRERGLALGYAGACLGYFELILVILQLALSRQ